jgi:predicted transcriptional regulator
MVRTQIYLTEAERDALNALAEATGKKQSELIREALDRFIDLAHGSSREAILESAAGMWSDRNDLPDFEAERRTWDKG